MMGVIPGRARSLAVGYLSAHLPEIPWKHPVLEESEASTVRLSVHPSSHFPSSLQAHQEEG